MVSYNCALDIDTALLAVTIVVPAPCLCLGSVVTERDVAERYFSILIGAPANANGAEPCPLDTILRASPSTSSDICSCKRLVSNWTGLDWTDDYRVRYEVTLDGSERGRRFAAEQANSVLEVLG